MKNIIYTRCKFKKYLGKIESHSIYGENNTNYILESIKKCEKEYDIKMIATNSEGRGY